MKRSSATTIPPYITIPVIFVYLLLAMGTAVSDYVQRFISKKETPEQLMSAQDHLNRMQNYYTKN